MFSVPSEKKCHSLLHFKSSGKERGKARLLSLKMKLNINFELGYIKKKANSICFSVAKLAGDSCRYQHLDFIPLEQLIFVFICHLAITVSSNNSKYLHTCLADVTCNYYPRSVHTCLADIDSQFFPCNLHCIHLGQLQGSLLWHEWQALNDAFYFSVLAITYNDVLS